MNNQIMLSAEKILVNHNFGVILRHGRNTINASKNEHVDMY